MNREEPMGLLAAGAIRQSFVARLPALLAQLGPVKSTSYPSARRAVKALHKGFAVSHYSALEMCPAIWIAVPESNLERMLHDLVAQTPIHRTIVVLCGSVHSGRWPAALHEAGARIASLNAIEESRERSFIAEGHPDAIRTLRKLLAEDGRKLIQIGAAAKGLYLAAIRMARDLILPTVAASTACLRAAGFPRAEAAGVVRALGERSLSAYSKVGDRAWSTQMSQRDLDAHLAALRAVDPRHAALFADALRHAQGYFKDLRETSVRHIDSGKMERQPPRAETIATGRRVRAARAGPGRGP